MAEAKRRGDGEDGIYFDHRADCRDSAQGQPDGLAFRFRSKSGADGVGLVGRPTRGAFMIG